MRDKKVAFVPIGTVGHIDYRKETLTAAITAVLAVTDKSFDMEQYMSTAPYNMEMGNFTIYDDDLYNNIHEEAKGVPPKGRSQKQHNQIMNLNKKGKTK